MVMNLPNEWVEKGDVFLKDAEGHIQDGLYWLSCFKAQQAAELYLRVFIGEDGRISIHA